MIEALLNGKLSREQENMEDILTSNIFGLLQYLPPHRGLLPFLRSATMLEGVQQNPLKDCGFEGTDSMLAEYEFWPRFAEMGCRPCEPDVLVRLSDQSAQKRFMVIIEAKYRHGKSSYASGDESDAVAEVPTAPPNDQLAREYDNLLRLAERENAKPLLIYLTADTAPPANDIEDSKNDFKDNSKYRDSEFRCAWLSWRHLSEVFDNPKCDPILQDIVRLTKRLNLIFFKGVDVAARFPILSWKFEQPVVNFDWLFAPLPVFEWNFRDRSKSFQWDLISLPSSLNWSFQK